MRRAVFLDRDGVLNKAYVSGDTFRPPRSVDELEILPGVAQACADLKAAGWLLIAVTNQPDIARGLQNRADLDAVNELLTAQLGLDDLAVCPHDDDDGCTCRKPKPGMVHERAQKWNVDLSQSVMVGDRWRDIEAGRTAGCATVYIDNEVTDDQPITSDVVVPSLSDAVPWILQRQLVPKE